MEWAASPAELRRDERGAPVWDGGEDAIRLSERERDLWRQAGTRLAGTVAQTYMPHVPRRPHFQRRRARLENLIAQVRAGEHGGDAEWLLDNVRLLQAAERESRPVLAHRWHLPWVVVAGVHQPRIALLVAAYLDRARDQFCDAAFAEFVEGFQAVRALKVSEIWSLRSALQLELVDRILAGAAVAWPGLFTSIRGVLEADWKSLFEWLSHVDRVLERDPAGAYAAMTADSRDLYRQTVAALAKRSRLSEVAIAEEALRLAACPGEDAPEASQANSHALPGPRLAGRAAGYPLTAAESASARRAHVGYYLVDAGLAALRAAIGYRPGLGERLRQQLLAFPTAGYLGGIAVLTVAFVFLLVRPLPVGQAVLAGILLLLPAAAAAVECIHRLVNSLLPPRTLPKLDFSEGIPAGCATLVAVPALLLDARQTRALVRDLEVRYFANRDPNLRFALLTDPADADCETDERDRLSRLCARLITELNRRHARRGVAPFLLLHRRRRFNPSEGRWMGWERKRGKLIELNRLLRGESHSFELLAGDEGGLRQIRYVLTLDADTSLPPETAARLVGAMAHPLNRAVLDPETLTVTQGYGIIQPRIGVQFHSARRSRLAELFSGAAGFDIYTRAVSDVYQDLFGEGNFTGKGIYDVDAFRATLERRFPENALLSHDLIEGLYARAALASDIELEDGFPSHYSALGRRKHRWMRGDWQLIGWLGSRVPDGCGRVIPNPLLPIARWKILDNLRRSFFEPALLALLVGSWLWLEHPARWLAAALGLLLAPALLASGLGLWRRPRGRGEWLAGVKKAGLHLGRAARLSGLSLALLLPEAMLALDAAARSLYRVFFSHRRLLEWETAAEAEARGRRAVVDTCLRWSPLAALALLALVALARPAALVVAAPLTLLWALAPVCTAWLDRPAPQSVCFAPAPAQRAMLMSSAHRLCRFFREWSTAEIHFLIPDSVREDGGSDRRLSPTNLAVLLNARIAALHLRQLSLWEFVAATRASLNTVLALEKFRGHLYNWYDLDTLAPLQPRFVSTADSGNLVAALWTLKQACQARAQDAACGSACRAIAADCERLVAAMDFRFLYSRHRRALSVGYDAARGERYAACYDLFTSESRLATFIAIAKGDIPAEAWIYLGRARARPRRALLSWTGTLFEYLLPGIWMRHPSRTLAAESARAAIEAQAEYARRHAIPWGFSESACVHPNGCGYGPFGLPQLAMKRMKPEAVVSPYSSFLALGFDPPRALENLLHMRRLGWFGEYGFFESADWRSGRPIIVRSWMAHHQGMSLLALANFLCGQLFQGYFHAEPQVEAAEILLHERLPEVEPPMEKPLGEAAEPPALLRWTPRWCGALLGAIAAEWS